MFAIKNGCERIKKKNTVIGIRYYYHAYECAKIESDDNIACDPFRTAQRFTHELAATAQL